MTPISPAALAVIRAAAEDYRLTTPPDHATPAGITDRIAEYLASEGYAIHPAPRTPYARLRAAITTHTRFRHRTRVRPPDARTSRVTP